MQRVLALSAAVFLAASPAAAQEDGWLRASPGYTWSFPDDHGPHSGYRTEWWYFTGHLRESGSDETRFGYQFTMFKVGVAPYAPTVESSWAASDVIMGHAAVTDLATGEHVFSEVVRRSVALLGGFGPPEGGSIAWVVAPAGTAGEWRLTWEDDAFGIQAADQERGIALDLVATRDGPMVFQGPNGYSRKAVEGDHASMYYSLPTLSTEGSLMLGDSTFVVSGTSWMDHEFSSDPLAEDQTGWDWLSLRLHDGRALMAFVLRDAQGRADFRHATLIGAEGEVRYLEGNEWTAEPLRRWRSSTTGDEYPVDWRLGVPSEDLSIRVEALVDSQENVSDLIEGLSYWEGAVRATDASGTEVGLGYLELTGYGTSPPPAL